MRQSRLNGYSTAVESEQPENPSKIRKQLPPGLWITLFPDPRTTLEELLAALAERGIYIEEDRAFIVHEPPKDCAMAVISVPKIVILNILNWLLEDQTLHGRKLVGKIPESMYWK